MPNNGFNTILRIYSLLKVWFDQPYKIGDDLTDRELEVLVLLAEGKSNAEIGQQLTISTSTAKHHVRAILSKLGAANRAEAVALALQHDLI